MGCSFSSSLRRVLALLAAFLVVTGLWAEVRQGELSDQILRLHVVANSDTREDQSRKLAVRDRILVEVEPLLSQAHSAQEAAALLLGNLDHLEEIAAQTLQAAGCEDGVEVVLGPAWFPTKSYGDLSLPAGRYQALRVVIGAGEGQNWWAVVFPSLCGDVSMEEALPASGFTQGQVSLLTEETMGYEVRFQLIEWWQTLKHRLAG